MPSTSVQRGGEHVSDVLDGSPAVFSGLASAGFSGLSMHVCAAAAALGAATAISALTQGHTQPTRQLRLSGKPLHSGAGCLGAEYDECAEVLDGQWEGGLDANPALSATYNPVFSPLSKTCSWCGASAACDGTCALAQTADALRRVPHLGTRYAGRMHGSTPSNTPNGSPCSTPPSSPRVSSATGHGSSLDSGYTSGATTPGSHVRASLARYPAIISAAEALVGGMPRGASAHWRRGPTSVASASGWSTPAHRVRERVVEHHHYHHHEHHHHHHHYHTRGEPSAPTSSREPCAEQQAVQQCSHGAAERVQSACPPGTRAVTPGLRCMSRASSSASDESASSASQAVAGSGPSAAVAAAAALTPEEVAGLQTSRVERRGRFVVMEFDETALAAATSAVVGDSPPPSSASPAEPGPPARSASMGSAPTTHPTDRQALRRTESSDARAPAGAPGAGESPSWLDTAAINTNARATSEPAAERAAEQAAPSASPVPSASGMKRTRSQRAGAATRPVVGSPGTHESLGSVSHASHNAFAHAHAAGAFALASGRARESLAHPGSLSSPGVGCGATAPASGLDPCGSLPLGCTQEGPFAMVMLAGGGPLSRTSSAVLGPWDTGLPALHSRDSGGLPPVCLTPQPTPRAYRKGRFNIQEQPSGVLPPDGLASGMRSSHSAFAAGSSGMLWSVEGGSEDVTLLTALSASVGDAGAAPSLARTLSAAAPGSMSALPPPYPVDEHHARTAGRSARGAAASSMSAHMSGHASSPNLATLKHGSPFKPRGSVGGRGSAASKGRAPVYRGLDFAGDAPVNNNEVGREAMGGSSGHTSGATSELEESSQGPPASFACWVDGGPGDPRWGSSRGSSRRSSGIMSLPARGAPPPVPAGLLDLRLDSVLGGAPPVLDTVWSLGTEDTAYLSGGASPTEAMPATGDAAHAALAARRPPALEVPAAESAAPALVRSATRVGRFTIVEGE